MEMVVICLFSAAALNRPEVGIDATSRQKALMITPFQDQSVYQDQDLIALENGGEAVCDSQSGPSFPELVKVLLDRFLGACVHGRSGFIKDEDRWVSKDRSSQGYPLPLTAGKFHAPFTNGCFITIGQRLDELPCSSDLRCFLHLLEGSIGPAYLKIFRDRSGEQERFLAHVTDVFSPCIHFDT